MKHKEYLKESKSLTIFQPESTSGSFAYWIQWYSVRHPRYRIAYRISGLLILIIGLTVPLWISLDGFDTKFFAEVAAFIVGLATFYSFKHGWAGYYIAEKDLLALEDLYDEALIRADLLAADPEKEEQAYLIVVKATQNLMVDVAKVVRLETAGYFSSTGFPTPLKTLQPLSKKVQLAPTPPTVQLPKELPTN